MGSEISKLVDPLGVGLGGVPVVLVDALQVLVEHHCPVAADLRAPHLATPLGLIQLHILGIGHLDVASEHDLE